MQEVKCVAKISEIFLFIQPYHYPTLTRTVCGIVSDSFYSYYVYSYSIIIPPSRTGTKT